MKNLEISFDVGHSSIGWSVFYKSANMVFPAILGTGVLLFDDEMCQAKDRASKRHSRKNIIARKNRIKLLRSVFVDLNVLTPSQLDNSKCDFPWLLASQVLNGIRVLSWEELWCVLRFYAHNRGYDGNSAWAKVQNDDGDSDKEQAAKALMQKYNTSSMVETMCAFLEVDVKSKERPNPKKYFKGENVAFPRNVVFNEVEKIIDAHVGVLPKCDENFKKLIIGNWREVSTNISLPKRYTSDRGLLFGQYVPRFDNRIITKCPISGNKVPVRHTRDFFEFRWKMLLSNLSSVDSVKREDLLKRIDELAHIYGRFTKTTLKALFEKNYKEIPKNIDAMFLTEEMEHALLVDPVKELILKTIYPNISKSLPEEALVKKLWNIIPNFILNQMFHFKEFSILDIVSKLDSVKADELKNIVEEIFSSSKSTKTNSKSKKKKQDDVALSLDDVLNVKIRVSKLSGRAPYSREVMKNACAEVMSCKDPRSVGGALYKSVELTKAELLTNIDTWTNNHLVRHRLKMLKRLFMDLVNRYADGKLCNVKSVTIEVVKDLSHFSGMAVKEKASILNNLIKHHKSVSAYLAKEYPDLTQNASIIRKARIADDLNWTCPYTGRHFSPQELFKSGNMEIEHIIPYSLRQSNALDSLVMTWKEVNDMKGQRTALEFIKEFQGEKVPGTNYEIQSLANYKKFVEGLKMPKHNYSEDDLKRIKRRKGLLLTEHYNKREGSFLPSDLTQTSYINKLAFKALKSLYVNEEKMPEFIHLPGSITGAVRKNWNLLGCIGEACPEIFDEVKSENGSVDRFLKTKSEIRSITHLHHAIDAVVMGLAASLFPHTTRFYELVLKRNLNKAECDELRKTGLFEFSEKKWRLIDLTPDYLREITNAINEGRVVKYLPKKMSGLKVEETMWRVVSENENGTVNLRQYTTSSDKKHRRKSKYDTSNKILLLGYAPQDLKKTKLSRNKAVFVINRNYGVALTNPPVIMPYINVWSQLQELAKTNGGKVPEVLRRNHLIEVDKGAYKGIWRVASIKNTTLMGIVLDLIAPAYIKENGKVNVRLKTLLEDGLRIINADFTGV